MSLIPSGRALLDSENLLGEAGLALDMHYADFGAGTLGHFVLPAAQIVGPLGQVYAVDILKSALQSIQSRAQLEGLTNLKIVWGDFERPLGVTIPPNTLHLISFVNVGHALLKSGAAFKEAQRLLRPNGRLLIIDWQPNAHAIIVPNEKRLPSKEIESQAVSENFQLMKRFVAGSQHWGLLFQKRS